MNKDCDTCHGMGKIAAWAGDEATVIPCPDCSRPKDVPDYTPPLYCFSCRQQVTTKRKRYDYRGEFAGLMCDQCWAGSGLNPENAPRNCWSCGRPKTECPDLNCLSKRGTI